MVKYIFLSSNNLSNKNYSSSFQDLLNEKKNNNYYQKKEKNNQNTQSADPIYIRELAKKVQKNINDGPRTVPTPVARSHPLTFQLPMPKVFTDKAYKDVNLLIHDDTTGGLDSEHSWERGPNTVYLDIDKHVNVDLSIRNYVKSRLEKIVEPDKRGGYRNIVDNFIKMMHMMPEVDFNLEQVKEILEKKIKQTDDTSILPDLKERLDKIIFRIEQMTDVRGLRPESMGS